MNGSPGAQTDRSAPRPVDPASPFRSRSREQFEHGSGSICDRLIAALNLDEAARRRSTFDKGRREVRRIQELEALFSKSLFRFSLVLKPRTLTKCPSALTPVPRTSLPRAAYADMFGPTYAGSRAARGHRAVHRGREGFHHYGEDGSRRRQGHSRRHGGRAGHARPRARSTPSSPMRRSSTTGAS